MKGRKTENRLSRPIVSISLLSIIIGVAVMIISVSIVKGFQEGIREKVIGFGAHIEITRHERSTSMESSPILRNQEFYPGLEEEDGVKNIQVFAYKPGLIQVFKDSLNDGNTSEGDIMGVLFKGIDTDYDWDFFADKLVEGELISFDKPNNEILISSYVSEKMGYQVGDEVDAHFIVGNVPKKRVFIVKGIYRTGFQEFDAKYMYCQLDHIQRLNKWGVQSFLTLADTCYGSHFVLKAITTGGSGQHQFDWGKGYQKEDYISFPAKAGFDITVKSAAFELDIFHLADQPSSLPDSASARIIVDKPCDCSKELLAAQPFQYDADSLILTPFGKVIIQNGTGSHNQYVGGFEVILENWEDLDRMDDIIYNDKIPFELKTEKITDRFPEIFAWLEFLDLNIIIILSLVLIVSLINMITSLLVVILEKTSMIGILMALGGSSKSIRKIFMYYSMYLLMRGLLWGNLIGIGLLAIQHFTGIIQLNPEAYYLDYAPVSFNLLNILLINLLTIIVCRLTLILPSLLVTRIKPIKAIKFQ